MKSLILDTSSEHALLAVTEGDQTLYSAALPSGPALSKSLGSELKKIVDACPPPYNRIILGVGPGSFTGIRVGAAMAQALSFGWQIPLYTASSLSAFAPDAPHFAIAIDARSGGVYIQLDFDKPKLFPLSEATEILTTSPLIASPHPSKILQRLPPLASAPWIETRPNPLQLFACAELAPSPLTLDYLSSP